MKEIFGTKKNVFIILLLLSAAITAQVAVNNKQTIDDKPASAEEKEKHPIPPGEDVWKEIEKISDSNDADSFTISGKIKLYDNLDEEGIQEQQDFLMQQQGENQRFRLDQFERIKMGHTLLLIDHTVKEITVQESSYADSVLADIKILSPKKMKKLLEKDGTIIEITTQGSFKVLKIKPGSMDAVNEYNIFYDPVSYEINKIRLSYTSFPYQDFLDGEDNRLQQVSVDELNPVAGNNNDESNTEPEIEMNITEYVLEFEFMNRERKSTFNFSNNEMFKVISGEMNFKEKLADYKVTTY